MIFSEIQGAQIAKARLMFTFYSDSVDLMSCFIYYDVINASNSSTVFHDIFFSERFLSSKENILFAMHYNRNNTTLQVKLHFPLLIYI
jgi:hypothetical protein